MRNYLTLFIWVIMFGYAGPALTQSNTGSNLVVVELYTSQGCSSCPPADALLTKLSRRKDVLALALHVDYWDYIGWKDVFGNPAHANRQRAYARAAGTRTIYTPQMIVGGTVHVVGSKPMEVLDEINKQLAGSHNISLSVRRSGNKVQISARRIGGANKSMNVQLVRYRPSEATKITRGENAGRTIEYTNIVTQWERIRNWDGSGTLNMAVNASGDDPVVIIVQETGPGRILAAALLQ